LWQYSFGNTKAWLILQGRFLLAFPLVYSFYYVFHDMHSARAADVLFLLAHIGLVVVLLRKIRLSWPAIGLFLIFLLALFQIRDDDDPIGAYAILCQTLGLAITGALILLLDWRRSGNPWMLAGSAVLAGLSLYIYELNIIYAPIAVAVVLFAPHGRRLRSLAIALAPTLIFCLATLYFRLGTKVTYGGTSLGSVAAVPTTYVKQLVGALPGSYYALRGHGFFPLSHLLPAALGSHIAWAIALLTFGLLVYLGVRVDRASNRVSWGAIAVAAAFVALPPVLIAVSAKYQVLGWGQAYIPVYYEYFGVAFLAALAFVHLIGSRPVWLVGAAALVVSVYTSMNWTMNMWQGLRLTQDFSEPAYTLVSALKGGLFDRVRDRDVVEIVNQPIYINGNLIYQVVRKDVSIPGEIVYQSKPRPGAKHYRLYRDPASGKAWKLVAAD
jgi:hypothetical protein